MPIKLLFVLAISAIPMMTYAEESSHLDFDNPISEKSLDLIREGNTLNLSQEGSIQQPTPPSTMYIALLAGGVQPTSLTATSNGHTMNYQFDKLLPIGSFQVSHYLWDKNGKWGWSGSLGYSYSQYQDTTSTALHLIPLELNAVYRLELKDTQKIIPYFMVGPALWTYFQRGADVYNTSQSALFGSGIAGVAFNLNRLHILSSGDDTEIVLQYQRTFGPTNQGMDFNGNTIQIGGIISL